MVVVVNDVVRRWGKGARGTAHCHTCASVSPLLRRNARFCAALVCCTAALEMKRTACATDGSTAAGGGAAGALGGGEAAAVAAAAAGAAGGAAGLMVGASDEAPGSEPRSQGLAFGGAGAAGAANAAGAVGPAAAGGAAGSRDVASSMAVSPTGERLSRRDADNVRLSILLDPAGSIPVLVCVSPP